MGEKHFFAVHTFISDSHLVVIPLGLPVEQQKFHLLILR